MSKFTFTPNVTLGNIVSLAVYLMIVVYSFARLESKIESEIERSTTQDNQIKELIADGDVLASKVQRNSEKFIGAEADQKLMDLRVSTNEMSLVDMEQRQMEQMQRIEDKFEELKELVIQLQYQ